MAEPILRPGNIVMRGDDPRCKSLPVVRDLPWWGRNARGVVEWAYEIRSRSRHSAGLSLSDHSYGGEKDCGLYAVLVMSAIKRALGMDYLIDTVDCLYGDDPESLYQLTAQLSTWCRVSTGKAMAAIESYQVGLCLSCAGAQKPERVLDDWHKMAMDVLEAEFLERGWVE